MPNRSQKKKKKVRNSNKSEGILGPLVLYKVPKYIEKVHRFDLKQIVTLTSSVGGVLDTGTNFTNNPSSAQDWSSVAALFDSYRVRKMSIRFFPTYPANTTAVVFSPYYLVMDPDSSTTPLSSANSAIQYDNMVAVPLFETWAYESMFPLPMSTASNKVGWLDVGGVTATGGIYGYQAGLTVSTTYGTALVTFHVEFCDRR